MNYNGRFESCFVFRKATLGGIFSRFTSILVRLILAIPQENQLLFHVFGRRSVNTTYPPTYTLILFMPSICPGRHLSDNSLYSIVSCILYDIKPPVDDQGNALNLKPEFTSGFLT